MAISTTIRKIQFDTSGGFIASYPFAFKFWDETEIKATLSTSSGDIDLTYGVDYSISTPGDSGTLTRIVTAAWVTATQLTIYRQIDMTQEVVLVNGGTQDAEIYMQIVDRTVAMSQEAKETLDRIVRFPITDIGTTPDLPDAESRKGLLLGFDNLTGDPIPVAASAGPAVVTPYMKTLLDDSTASEAQTTLGMSAFMKTLLDDSTASAHLDTLGATTFGKAILQGAVSGSKISGLNADIISERGIGVTVLPSLGDPNAAVTSGIYSDDASYSGKSPFYGQTYATVIVMPRTTSSIVQYAFSNEADNANGGVKMRSSANGGSTWTAWATIWTSVTDGNGGQPPAPRPKTASGIGQIAQIRVVDTYTLPSGGTWFYYFIWFVTASNLYSDTATGIASGGTNIFNTAGLNLSGFAWRIA